MKVKRIKLEEKLNRVFTEIARDKNTKKQIANKLKHKNIMLAEVNSIVEKTTPIMGLDQPMLYTITKATFKVLHKEIINPKNYFTENQINEYDKFKIKKEDVERYPIIFNKVLKYNDKHYHTQLTAQEVTDLFARMVLKYNPNTQRPLKNNNIDTDLNSVKQIGERILEGKQKTNTITFNILEGSGEVFYYDEDKMQLIIKSGEIDMPDGYHRSMGMKYAVDKNPDVEFVIGVSVMHFDEDNINDYIIQENTRNEIDERYLKSINPENLNNKVVEKLNDKSKCDLGNMITTDKNRIKQGKALVFTDTMSETIDYHFNIKTHSEKDKVAKWMVEFFNFLVGSYKEEFLTNIKETKKISNINHNNMFVGYIALAKKLYKDPNWQEKLINTISKIDFSNSNEELSSLMFNAAHFSKSSIKKVSNYFIKHLNKI